MSARIHTRGCASAKASMVSIRKRTERGSRKERYILGRTGGLRRAKEEGRGDGIEDNSAHASKRADELLWRVKRERGGVEGEGELNWIGRSN